MIALQSAATFHHLDLDGLPHPGAPCHPPTKCDLMEAEIWTFPSHTFSAIVATASGPLPPFEDSAAKLHPNIPHWDNYTLKETAEARVETFPFVTKNIDAWTLELEGRHSETPIPEPASLILLTTGVIAGAGTAWRQRKRSP